MQNIKNFYADKTIFVTGGSGFMGKVLIEKLLRSCPDVKKINVLLRPKKNKDARERLEALLNSKIFGVLYKTDRLQLSKVVAVPGDITEPDLGLGTADLLQLEDEVNIIFHAAATVKFDERLKTAMSTNVRSTKTLLKMAQRMANLDIFVHVSTAYSNCDRSVIEEIIYPTAYNASKLLETVELLDDHLLEDITPKILGQHPNTYTFTKSLAESLIQQEHGDTPVVIVRPSMVTCAWKEPMPGWVDTFYGPGGMLVYIGKGLARSIVADKDVIADIIPVDVSINTMISAAWYSCQHPSKRDHIPVYNSVSGSIKPNTWGNFDRLYMQELKKMPLAITPYYSSAIFTKSIWVNDLYKVLGHYIPALVVDSVLMLTGKRPKVFKIQKFVTKGASIITHFMTHQWDFKSENVQKLWKCLSAEDQEKFWFDLSTIDWKDYINIYSHGIRKYLLNEENPVEKSKLRLGKIRKTWGMLSLLGFALLFLLSRRFARRS